MKSTNPQRISFMVAILNVQVKDTVGWQVHGEAQRHKATDYGGTSGGGGQNLLAV